MARLAAINLHPDERTLRRFGWLALCAFGALGACVWWGAWPDSGDLGAARIPLALALLAVAVWSALCSWHLPRGNRGLWMLMSVLGYPIGVASSYLLLALLFFGLFAPAGALLRRTGHDPMQRAWHRERRSYWERARPRRDRRSYFRQF